MSNFINIKSLNSQQIPEKFNSMDNLDEMYEQCIEIYQVQAIKDSSLATINKVGVMMETHDVLIKELELPSNYKLYMVSKLYNLDTITELYNSQRIPMIQANIIKSDSHYGSLFFNFCPADNYFNINKLKDIKGHFTVTYHFKDEDKHKYIELEKIDLYCGNVNMLSKIIELALKELT